MRVKVTLTVEHEVMQEDEKIITKIGADGCSTFSDSAKLALSRCGFEVGCDYGDGYAQQDYTVLEMEVIHDDV